MTAMSTEDRLVHMANQIARNFAIAGDAAAAHATADHIATFWDPSMKQRILRRLTAGDAGLTPIATLAIRQLRDHAAPPPASQATMFAAVDQSGASDAG